MKNKVLTIASSVLILALLIGTVAFSNTSTAKEIGWYNKEGDDAYSYPVTPQDDPDLWASF